MQIVQGPDFSDSGIHHGAQETRPRLQDGARPPCICARATISRTSARVSGKPSSSTELPYQVNKASLIERIADLVRDQLIEGIASDGLRDEYDKVRHCAS